MVHGVYMATIRPLLHLLASSSDSGQVQSATLLLSDLVAAGGRPLLGWAGPDEAASLQALLEPTRALLRPDCPESNSCFVGHLLYVPWLLLLPPLPLLLLLLLLTLR